MKQLQSQDTAILLFSRTSEEEARVKWHHPSLNQNKKVGIASRLIDHSLSIAHHSKLPVFTRFSNVQSGSDFGERLANAIEEIYAQGYQKVIAIGNDCPLISAQLLRDVAAALMQQQAVLGPARDGGLYLIGLQKSAYHRHEFLNLAWESSALQRSWRHYQVSTYWLKSLSDVDTFIDLKQLVAQLPFAHFLRQQLLSILASAKVDVNRNGYLLSNPSLPRTRPQRGPPYRATFPTVKL
ncbi:MAG: DUF2064 domain-containing protein [Salibacteraceae bacterium]